VDANEEPQIVKASLSINFYNVALLPFATANLVLRHSIGLTIHCGGKESSKAHANKCHVIGVPFYDARNKAMINPSSPVASIKARLKMSARAGMICLGTKDFVRGCSSPKLSVSIAGTASVLNR
jgi:hypothetical protein